MAPPKTITMVIDSSPSKLRKTVKSGLERKKIANLPFLLSSQATNVESLLLDITGASDNASGPCAERETVGFQLAPASELLR